MKIYYFKSLLLFSYSTFVHLSSDINNYRIGTEIYSIKMSNVSLIDLLKDGNNEFSSEIKDEGTNTEKLRKEVSVSYDRNILSSSAKMKTKPSFLCSEPSVTKQHDIDINYAINLLKKEDQNTNVYVLLIYQHYFLPNFIKMYLCVKF